MTLGTCVSTRAGQRKAHNSEAGYIAQRDNPYAPGTHVVIYDAAQQGLDDEGGRYAVVCEAHGVIVNVTSMPRARSAMKAVDFCEDCMETLR
jgi:hypothetical protein